jgi:hypothetical protein
LTVKNILIVAAKNAVNAVLTNAALMAKFPTVFNIHSKDGWWNLAYAIGSVVLAREVMVWIPELLRWSRTNAEPSQP